MKHAVGLLILLFTLIWNENLQAQQECKVLLSSIAGAYEGGCKGGKANGSGTATGTDSYVGQFKDGLPHGQGVYKWKDGNTHDGLWEKGKKTGTGTMTYVRPGKQDSVVSGYWQKDKYVGLYEKPYLIHSRSSQIANITITPLKDNSNSIQIEVQNTTAGVQSLSSGATQPKPEVTDISLRKGNFLQSTQMVAGPKSTVQQLIKVDYPFRALIRFGRQEADIEILQPGSWKIFVNMNN